MNNEYIIVNKTALLKMREELIHVSDYQRGQMDLIDAIVSSQSTPLIPEIEKAFDAGVHEDYLDTVGKQDYFSNLKLDI